MMTPIDDDCNPWRSTYPCLAVHDTAAPSTQSLFHAILAHSAFHLANLKESKPGRYHMTATQHFGLALRHLRSSLASPTENFSSTLAAILTVTLAEHVFHGQSKGLRHHLQGAVQHVAQYVARKPWAASYESWVITQSFVLHTLMSQIMGDGMTNTPDTAITLHEVFQDVLTDPRFAYTLGSTPRLMKALYHARLLEIKLGATGISRDGRPDLSEDDVLQASQILFELNAPLNADVELYMTRHQPLPKPAQQRKFIVSNLNIFKSAVTIFLLCTVLRYPPSAVAEQVLQVLSAAELLLKMDGAAPSIWPLFIASAEAYTPEMQALADCVLSLSVRVGATNREVIQRVVKQIWRKREQVAANQRSDVGETLVNWREVLQRLDIEILPL